MSDDFLRRFAVGLDPLGSHKTDLARLKSVADLAKPPRMMLGDSVAAALDSIADSRLLAIGRPSDLIGLAEEARRLATTSAVGRLEAEFARMQYALLDADCVESFAFPHLSKAWRHEIGLLDRVSARYASILDSISPSPETFDLSGRSLDLEMQRGRDAYRDAIDPTIGVGISAVLQRELRYAERVGAAHLDEISSALRQPPFSAQVTDALRSLLGDFRHHKIPEDFSPRINERANATYAMGFEPSLTAFPRGFYWPVLDAAGIPASSPAPSAPPSASRHSRSRAYGLLVEFESSLRRFVAARLRREYGEDWIEVAIPSGKREKWRRYRAQESNGDEHQEIEYSDLLDFISVVTEHRNWERVFSRFFGTPESFRESIVRLNPWRRRVAHSRGGWAKQELLLARVEIHRLLVAMEFADPLEDIEIEGE